jgi:hypothetical protein
VTPTPEQQHKIHLAQKISVQHCIRHQPVREGEDKVIWVAMAYPDLLVPDLEEVDEVKENLRRCYYWPSAPDNSDQSIGHILLHSVHSCLMRDHPHLKARVSQYDPQWSQR